MTMLECPRCGFRLDARNVGWKSHEGECPSCRTKLLMQPVGAPRQLVPLPAQALPAHYHLRETPTGMRLEWKWRVPSAGAGALGFNLLHLFFVGVFAFCTVISLLLSFRNPCNLVLVAFAGWITFRLVYPWLTESFNSTVIEVTPERLTIRHGPLPSDKNWDLERNSLVELYIQTRDVTTKGRYLPRGGITNTYHELFAKSRDGRTFRLFSDLESKRGVALKQVLDKALGFAPGHGGAGTGSP